MKFSLRMIAHINQKLNKSRGKYLCVSRSRRFGKSMAADLLDSGVFRSYWTGTETYEALKAYIDLNFNGLKEAVIGRLGRTDAGVEPSGKGFADVVYFPKRKVDQPALLVELKWNQSVKGAVAQIKDRQYAEGLPQQWLKWMEHPEDSEFFRAREG